MGLAAAECRKLALQQQGAPAESIGRVYQHSAQGGSCTGSALAGSSRWILHQQCFGRELKVDLAPAVLWQGAQGGSCTGSALVGSTRWVLHRQCFGREHKVDLAPTGSWVSPQRPQVIAWHTSTSTLLCSSGHAGHLHLRILGNERHFSWLHSTQQEVCMDASAYHPAITHDAPSSCCHAHASSAAPCMLLHKHHAHTEKHMSVHAHAHKKLHTHIQT